MFLFCLVGFFYLSSYSDLRLKFGQFFLVHSAVSKEREIHVNYQKIKQKFSTVHFKSTLKINMSF